MNTLTELYVLAGLFILANILDALTTYLGLFKVPKGLEGREMNPLFRNIKGGFRGFMVIKFMIVLLGAWFFLWLFSQEPGQGIFIFSVLDLTFGFVVLNNLYIFLRKRVTKRRAVSPIGYVSVALQKLHIPERGADALALYVSVLILCAISIIIVRLV